MTVLNVLMQQRTISGGETISYATTTKFSFDYTGNIMKPAAGSLRILTFSEIFEYFFLG